ncbi:DUF2399 domain-containing protein [Pengzhenrongella sp.]|jgi:hypothetical protein|uniref:DUF2399 domain-containing protein n=1 Tax=Pengzhenrongella sp. TaxID=2888820 RepID=UPI002F9250C5
MADPGDLPRLRRLLGGPDLDWLVQRVRGRIALGSLGPDGHLAGTVQLREPTTGQRAAAAGLVGPARRASAVLRVDLGELEDLVRRGVWSAGLADAVIMLTGPVANRSAERAAEEAAWVAAGEGFAPGLLAHPVLGPWWERWCAAGQLKRAARSEEVRRPGPAVRDDVGERAALPDVDVDVVAGAALPDVARRLASRAADCLCALPSAGEPLAVFARRITGDAHALDPTRPLGRLVLAAVSALGGGIAAPDDSLGPREVWASAGLLMSAVSSTVLCLGVPGWSGPGGSGPGGSGPGGFAPGGSGPGGSKPGGSKPGGSGPGVDSPAPTAASSTASALAGWRATGIPVVLTLDQVRSGGVGVVPSNGLVHVCENPSVVEMVASEAAHRSARGTEPWPSSGGGPVLVCTYGQPGAAVLELLERLTGAGAGVRYHGDFDWAGLRIAGTLAARIPWQPWRFGAIDYADAVVGRGRVVPGPAVPLPDAADPAARQHLPLRGPPAASPWDPALAVAMSAHGVAIEEEEVVARLVADLLD